jgi:hypothetical protein
MKIIIGKNNIYIGLNFGLYVEKPVKFEVGNITKTADIRVMNAIKEKIRVNI